MKQHHIKDNICEWKNVDRATFENEIIRLNEPAVLKNAMNDWKVVNLARSSTIEAITYLASIDNNQPAYTIVGQPEIDGRFFYSNDLNSTNFRKLEAALTATLEQLYALRDNPKPHSVAVQAASIRTIMPGFEDENPMPLLAPSIQPTAWLGNKAIVAPHYDVHDNLACVAIGKRRFTLFPPDQISNLYIGPTLNAPGGVPISMVDLRNPDFIKHPRFAEAIAVSKTAILEPGDAIYIPSPWWHAVESLDSINLLVNYWWGGLENKNLSPNHSLMHSMLTVAKLEPAKRDAWRHFFDYLVFKNQGDPSEHLPNDLNDLVTNLSPEQQQGIYEFLRSKLC